MELCFDILFSVVLEWEQNVHYTRTNKKLGLIEVEKIIVQKMLNFSIKPTISQRGPIKQKSEINYWIIFFLTDCVNYVKPQNFVNVFSHQRNLKSYSKEVF